MRKVRILLFTFLFFVIGGNPVYADEVQLKNPTSLENIGTLITKVSGVVTPLAVVGFIFMVIYAGFVRMTAAGDVEKEKRGMKIAVSAMIGFAIIALAPLLINVLARLIGVSTSLTGG
jgi:hypothetical protein